MGLYVNPDAYARDVLDDLFTICPDPGLTYNSTTGQLSYWPSQSSLGCIAIATLVGLSGRILVRGAGPGFGLSLPSGEATLGDVGGVCVKTSPSTAEIVYDVTGCGGEGYWKPQLYSGTMDFPSHAILYHELSHAYRKLTGTELSDDTAEEASVSLDTNQYLISKGLPEADLGGGCNGTGAGAVVTDGCFVATAAYHTESAPQVQFLRWIRDHIVRRTRWGQAFFGSPPALVGV